VSPLPDKIADRVDSGPGASGPVTSSPVVSNSVVLGIDGGGTNTRAVIASGGTVLARVQGSSIKRLRVGAEAAEESLRALLRDVFDAAGVSHVDAASAGVASASMPGISDWITEVFRDFGIQNSEVVGDEVIALDAAFQGGPGILQIAGTGSNCIGRTAHGQYESAGGYSSVLGDEGSGYWIGLHSIRQALHAYDRGERTIILDRVAAAWGTSTLEELVDLGNAIPGPDFSALAPIISSAAEEGDAVATRVLLQAASDLAEFILLVRRKLRHRAVCQIDSGSWFAKVVVMSERSTEQIRELLDSLYRADSRTHPGNSDPPARRF
jgi:glucosamine kinase